MKRFAACTLLLCFTVSATAQQASQPLPDAPQPTALPRNPAWDRVEQLPLDAAVGVVEKGRSGPTSCRLDHADEDNLTCTTDSYGNPRRLVFPRGNIAIVYTERSAPDAPKGALIAVGAFTGIFTIVGAVNGGGDGAGYGALFGSLFSLSIFAPYMLHRHPTYHLQRRLLYTAP